MLRKPVVVALVLGLAVLPCSSAAPGSDPIGKRIPIEAVDPHIGTGGFGFGVGGDPVGVQIPFGCVRLSPDGSDGPVWLDFLHYGGYHYSDTDIRCFSHTHMVGSGVSDLGNLGVMATTAVPAEFKDRYWFRSSFSHDRERASPHEYAVNLTSGIDVVLTACGSHTAKQRYTFPPTAASGSALPENGDKKGDDGSSDEGHGGIGDRNSGGDRKWNGTGGCGGTDASGGGGDVRRGRFLVFDMGHSLSSDGKAVVASNVSVTINNDSALVTGYARNKGSLSGRNGVGIDIFFAAHVSAAPTTTATWNGTLPKWKSTAESGVRVGAILQFDTSAHARVEVTSAISFVSSQQARTNLRAQTKNGTVTYEQCRASTHRQWTRALSVVEVHDSAAVEASTYTQFYTALYHAFLAPTQWSEEGGAYLGMDGRVHTTENGVVRYTDMSIWDIHRTQVPLLDLLHPDVSTNIARSLVGMYREGGDIPRWPIANVYAGCMIATHANIMLAGMVAKNITGFDIRTAYEGMRQQATNATRPHIGRNDLEDYIKLGYVTLDKSGKAASETLAYAYDDWALAQVARYLGKTHDELLFLNRSKSYRNVWEPKSKFMCPRTRGGEYKCHVDPAWHEWLLHDAGFCEGNQAEWRWFVPHDLQGLISLFGGRQAYVDALSTFFNKTWGDPSTTLPNPHYWAGNEPGILEPFQFHAAGRADLSQVNSRRVLKFAYNKHPGGLPGNDDYGTLSAWYVWATLGLYPLAGSDLYFVGSPVFPNVTLHLPTGSPLNIVAHNTSDTNVYVRSISLNGRPIDPFFANTTHAALTSSSPSVLELHMGDAPAPSQQQQKLH